MERCTTNRLRNRFSFYNLSFTIFFHPYAFTHKGINFPYFTQSVQWFTHLNKRVSAHTGGSSEHICPERWATIVMVPGDKLGILCLAQRHLSHDLSTLWIEPSTFQSQTQFFLLIDISINVYYLMNLYSLETAEGARIIYQVAYASFLSFYLFYNILWNTHHPS